MDSKLGLQASKAKISNATEISDPLELRTLSSETPQIENNHKCSEASQNSYPSWQSQWNAVLRVKSKLS